MKSITVQNNRRLEEETAHRYRLGYVHTARSEAQLLHFCSNQIYFTLLIKYNGLPGGDDAPIQNILIFEV